MTAVVWLAIMPAPRAAPTTTFQDNGSSANRVDILILGDGYTAAELASGKYASDVDGVVQSLFAQEPYSEYRNYYNVTRIDVTSAQSGADHPERNPQVFVDTAFDATYNCGNIVRLICVSVSKVNAMIAASGIAANARDVVLVLVNDATYGGSGGSIAVASTNSAVVELVWHEVGHSFALLADEYGGPPPPACSMSEPSAVNATRETVRDLIKWNAWIDPDTPVPTTGTAAGVPGLYQGAVYCDVGAYRPTYNSKMRSLGVPFYQINGEQHIRRIYNFVSPIDGSGPTGSTITTGPSQLFTVTVPQPFTHDLDIEWRVDDVLMGTLDQFTANGLTPGPHTVTVTVIDPTTMVRNDPAGLLVDVRTWSLTTVATPGAFGKTVPANGGVGQSSGPTLSWGTSTSAQRYEYCYDLTNDNACSAWISTGTNTSVALSVAGNTTHYWQVRAVNGGLTTYADGSAGTIWDFTTQAVQGDVFNVIDPSNGAPGKRTRQRPPQIDLDTDTSGGAFLYDSATGQWSRQAPEWALYPGDFNGDGLADLFLYRSDAGAYYVALNNGAGYDYTAGYSWAAGWTPYVGDFDGDGSDDLFLYHATAGVWVQMMSDGVGGFTLGGHQTWTSGVWYQARNMVLGSFDYRSGLWEPGLTIVTRAPVR